MSRADRGGDRETEPDPARVATSGLFETNKWLYDSTQLTLGYAGLFVIDPDFDLG